MFPTSHMQVLSELPNILPPMASSDTFEVESFVRIQSRLVSQVATLRAARIFLPQNHQKYVAHLRISLTTELGLIDEAGKKLFKDWASRAYEDHRRALKVK